MFPPPTFFAGARLNFAENLLFPAAFVDESAPALLEATEAERKTVTWAELRERVRRCQAGLVAAGLGEAEGGSRLRIVAGYVANHADAVVAMLAATSLGCAWTAISPDTGVAAVLDRLRQIEPVVLFADDASFYNGKLHPVLPKVAEIAAALPSVATTVVVSPHGERKLDLTGLTVPETTRFIPLAEFASPEVAAAHELHFAQLPPDHPVYILYSSGTTGAPKCMVHGAAGTLVQHKKEHQIHCDVGPGSRLFYFTTCTWMMWHWLVSGLASGATLVLYDGSPFRSPDHSSSSVADDLAMPRLIESLRITHFGTSAKYLSVLEQRDLRPRDDCDLSSLRAIYSTGSPLAASTFAHIYARAFPPNINLGSITGGTDIISLFGAPNALLPVRAGEIQGPGLGMAVRALETESLEGDGSPRDVTAAGLPGDLVCVRAFPCQPVSFFGPGGEEKYRKSYFDEVPGVWHHGDFVRFRAYAPSPSISVEFSSAPSAIPTAMTGTVTDPITTKALDAGPDFAFGLVMLGRTDGVLKPAGVRFGSAEIYACLARNFPAAISDAVCVGRRRPDLDDDERVLLFVVLAEGVDWEGWTPPARTGTGGAPSLPPSAAHTPSASGFSTPIPHPHPSSASASSPRGLAPAIRAAIRRDLSARHVPAVVATCPAVPVTSNGKKVEGAVRAVVNAVTPGAVAGEGGREEDGGRAKRARTVRVRGGAVSNPECLAWFERWAAENE